MDRGSVCMPPMPQYLRRKSFTKKTQEEHGVHWRVVRRHSEKVTVAAKATVPPLNPFSTLPRRDKRFHFVCVGAEKLPQKH
jgi:hypothetical protein